jgi:transketolase
MRRTFAQELHKHMQTNDKIVVIVGDLGYKMFDGIREDFPDKFYNVGAAEHAMIGCAIGMSYEGMIPFCYSITPFLLFRPYEAIRNYVNHEKVPIKLIGAGRDKDYLDNGFSHWAKDDWDFISAFTHINYLHPQTKEEVPNMVTKMINTQQPFYLSLSR